MKAVVVAIGMNSYFGKTARLVQSAKSTSHFQRAVLKIGNLLIFSTLALVALIIVVALFRHDPLVDTVLFALILTVATIPVALPAVLSVTMAVGSERLAKMRAIVSWLVAIEEMAGMDVVCSDKTGTLTKNELTLGDPILVEAPSEADVLVAAALASRADHADAIDATILKFIGSSDLAHALEGYRVTTFHAFDPVRKRSEAEVERYGALFKVTKGAPQAVLDLVRYPDTLIQTVRKKVDELAAKGYRTLGVARTDEAGQWQYLGLLSLFDPPREDSAEALEAGRAMGLTIKLVTGDDVAIAKEMAGKLHLGTNILPAAEVFEAHTPTIASRIDEADGFAQVFPEHKFEFVKTLQAEGHIVGMTGDGVNDAPALKQADVGIAVSGATDAARAAADLVPTAPGLSVIGAAIEEARRIFERMNSYAIYRISETIRVLLFMTLAILVFDFYPVTAVMIILLTIFLTRNTGAIWQRPLPSWKLLVTTEATQVVGTLAAVYGWFIEPIGWTFALSI